MTRIRIKDLSGDHIDAQSTNIDWQEAAGENGDGWTSYEAMECQECHVSVLCMAGCGDERHSRLELESECDGHVSLAEGPMMSYWYPCDWSRYTEDTEDAAKRIAHLPLCLVEFEDGTKGLALTGGGMDLSWEICEAYILLGYLPPRVFAGDLPVMRPYSGKGSSQPRRMRLVLSAAKRTVTVMRRWLDSDLRRIRRCDAGEVRP